jgi:glycopeptide antibiotics resistance protein
MALLIAPLFLPVILSIIFRLAKWRRTEIPTYFLTVIGVFFFPYFLFQIGYFMSAEDIKEGGRCAMGDMAILFLNIVIFIPIGVLIQFLSNKIILRRKRTVPV